MGEHMHIPAPEKRWSWGNILSIIPLLFVVAIWLYDRAKSAEVIPELQSTQSELKGRVSVLESKGNYADARYAEIIRRLERIDDKLTDRASK